jgi:putative transposase
MQELSGVSEVARELAMSRFRLIQPHLEKNWVSQYRKFGLIALVRKSRDDRGAYR